MSGYLAYLYSCSFTKEEELEIDNRVKESQKEFIRGANAGFKIGLTLYSIHSLTTGIANTSDQGPTTCPSSAPSNKPSKGVVKPKPGFKPVAEKHTTAAGGGALAICGAAFANGDFLLGLSYMGMAMIMMAIMNRD